MFGFRSFQDRIVFWFLSLVSLGQIAVFLAVDIINARHARHQIEIALEFGGHSFQRHIQQRTEQLSEAARILAGDFAFKTAIATREKATMQSVLENHSVRIGADLMLLISLDETLIAQSGDTEVGELTSPLRNLIMVAEQRDRAWAVVELNGEAYRLLVIPVLAPIPVAWLAVGFHIDDKLALELHQFTNLGVSFFQRDVADAPRILASSLPPASRVHLARALAREDQETQAPIRPLRVVGEEHLALVAGFGVSAGRPIQVLLQRSLDEEMAPFQRLRLIVFVLSLGGLLLSLFGALFIARSVTRPLRALAQAVRGVEGGNYDQRVVVRQKDELGELAGAFNRMVKGLVERDRVRNVLGMVVSNAVAESLLSRKIELGGEEREVSVLFSDLRNFTAFSERRSPQEVVKRLNEYLTRMSAIVEANHGVVDKYLGDGVMAIFGAPVQHEDDAGNALKAALDMCAALDVMNTELEARGIQRLDMGVGVNTGTVVAGNMGSLSRLNYTVVGDGVNLASRLEGLTKRVAYNTRVIASRATLDKARRRFETRELGMAQVRGRDEEIEIFAVLGYAADSVLARNVTQKKD